MQLTVLNEGMRFNAKLAVEIHKSKLICDLLFSRHVEILWQYDEKKMENFCKRCTDWQIGTGRTSRVHLLHQWYVSSPLYSLTTAGRFGSFRHCSRRRPPRPTWLWSSRTWRESRLLCAGHTVLVELTLVDLSTRRVASGNKRRGQCHFSIHITTN